ACVRCDPEIVAAGSLVLPVEPPPARDLPAETLAGDPEQQRCQLGFRSRFAQRPGDGVEHGGAPLAQASVGDVVVDDENAALAGSDRDGINRGRDRPPVLPNPLDLGDDFTGLDALRAELARLLAVLGPNDEVLERLAHHLSL